MLDEDLSDVCEDQSALMPDVTADGWLRRHRQRLAQIGMGHLLYATFNWFFDNILYVFVVYQLGLLVGGVIMTTLSLVQCAATLLVYERMGIDWVGVGSLARLSLAPKPSWWQRIVRWAMGRGNTAIFIVLCICQDPFITTAYFRRGRFDGLKGCDWRIFFGSVFVSNFYWTLRSGVAAVILVKAWGWIGQGMPR
jgi:hypothetical protein